jgi:hypothetical protein
VDAINCVGVVVFVCGVAFAVIVVPTPGAVGVLSVSRNPPGREGVISGTMASDQETVTLRTAVVGTSTVNVDAVLLTSPDSVQYAMSSSADAAPPRLL